MWFSEIAKQKKIPLQTKYMRTREHQSKFSRLFSVVSHRGGICDSGVETVFLLNKEQIFGSFFVGWNEDLAA